MTREIKFKIWDTIDKKWLENFTVYQYGNVASNGEWLETNTVIKCQFTGLKDKNGKEIYEGDLVLLEGTQKMVVEYDYFAKFTLANQLNTVYGFEQLELYPINSEYKPDIEVIGNIYENPDLLLPQSKIN